jgi:uncharacterized protein with FMN-binding domain
MDPDKGETISGFEGTWGEPPFDGPIRGRSSPGRAYAGITTLEVTLEAGKITDVQIVTSGCTLTVRNRFLPRARRAVIAANAFDPSLDAIAGASAHKTRDAFVEAGINALNGIPGVTPIEMPTFPLPQR